MTAQDWEALADAHEMGEEKRWDAVAVGDRVEIYLEHGPVVETNVVPLFCGHRFADGFVRAQPRDLLVRIKRDMTAEEREQFIARQKQFWAEVEKAVENNG